MDFRVCSLSFFRRKVLSLALTIVGIGLLGYVGAEYWGMYHAQRSLEAQWERQSAVSAQASGPPVLSPEDLLTKVSIPKINLDAIIVEGASRKQLSIGPGHITTTALPGESGNAVITGHRDTFFRHIYELNKGDEILVRRNGQTFHYEVTGKKVVHPEDISVLNPTRDARLTLITCYPIYYIGPAPERLVVFSRLVEGAVTQPAQSAESRPQ